MNLRALARHHGLTTGYDDRAVPDATLRTILRGLGQDPDAPPQGSQVSDDMTVPDGVRCHLPRSLRDAPGWGVFCQLYELRSERNWGIGDFADLAHLAHVCWTAGADFLGINPVHALFLSDPERASPFSPSSRRFLNPIYIAPDLLGCARPAGLPDGDLVDYAAVTRAKMRALRAAFDSDVPGAALESYVAQGGAALRRHALFEAISARHPGGWHAWPEALRDPGAPDVAAFARDHAGDVRFHLWLQWVAERQLDAAQAAAREAGMRLGLYLDLAVGTALDGSATWTGADAMLPGVTVGAPPDVFSQDGQNWLLAAPSPAALRDADLAPFRAMIAAQLDHAGALRIDHAMALWQLFLIPEDGQPSEGTHLRYPFAQMLRVLAEESRRAGAVVIGEDLGWVPEGFRPAMGAANILSYRIVYFEQSEDGFAPASAYPEAAMACLSTHDLPTLASWSKGEDIELREAHGLVSSRASGQHRAHREWERRHLARAVGAAENADPDALLDAAHRFMAATPCLLAGVRLADLVGPERPTNLPGTVHEYPNWRVRSATPVETIAGHPTFVRVTDIMRKARPRP
ncbi:MAG: 4-alpha-glucanotransferase [Pseudomonadota bacterium]